MYIYIYIYARDCLDIWRVSLCRIGPGFQVHGSLLEELPESHGNVVEDEHHVSSTYRRPVGEGHTSVRGHAVSIRPELQG